VHGAWADASGWSGVIERLEKEERFMAERAGAEIVEVHSSHVSTVFHPGKVTA
jgi:hypothetical protein